MALTPPNVQFNATDRGSQYMFKLNAIAQAIDLAVNGFNQQLAAANDANLFAQTAQTAANAATTKASEVETARAQVATNTATVNTKASEVEAARAQVATNTATVNKKASEVEAARAQVATNATTAQQSATTAVQAANVAVQAAQEAQDFAGGNFVTQSDGRLSDAREWTADTVSQPEAEAGAATTRRAWTAQRIRQAILAVFGARSINSGTGLSGGGNLSANRTLSVDYGSAAGTACQGNDARLSDAREWTADTVSANEAKQGSATTRRAWTSQRVAQAIAAQAQAKAPTYLNGNATLVANTDYQVNGNRTLTLPAGSPVGSKIRITKTLGSTVTINRGGSETIKWSGGTDTQVIFNINAEIVFVRNAASQWEI